MAKSSRKKVSLRASLSNHQSRLQHAAAAKEAAQRESPLSRSTSRRTIPFRVSDRILLIGEGNFSFARALLRHPQLKYLPPENITATSYDSENICLAKYPESEEIISELRNRGARVLFGVDATRLDQCKPLRGSKWDRVVWNFPHAGKDIPDRERNILTHQILLLNFFSSVAPFLTDGVPPQAHRPKRKKTDSDDEDKNEDEDERAPSLNPTRGTLLVTIRNTTPYNEWALSSLAKSPPASHYSNPRFHLLRSFTFHRDEWPGYEHRMTKGFVQGIGTGGDRARANGKDLDDRTWEFYLAT